MKALDNTLSTTECLSETSEKQKKVPDEKVVSLLKFVYYERKSIKQAAKYLDINYNSAKRILKQFRRGQISIEIENETGTEDFMNGLKSYKNSKAKEIKGISVKKGVATTEKVNKVNKAIPAVNENSTFVNTIKEFQILSGQLHNLHSEIIQNQNALQYLINCTYKMVNYPQIQLN
jgi:hypothetical protein